MCPSESVRPAAQTFAAETAVAGAAPAAVRPAAARPAAEAVVKSAFMDAADIDRALTRIAHQILEGNKGTDKLALVGIVTRGDVLARRLARIIAQIEGVEVPLGQLDISFYRDDFATYISPEVLYTDIPFSIDGMHVVLVDDVLFTGRTIRAALDALMDEGRPASVRLAVLVDRGHRELPIRADYAGKEIATSMHETVRLLLEETDGENAAKILETASNEASGGEHGQWHSSTATL